MAKYIATTVPSFATLLIWLAVLSVGSYAMFLAAAGPFEVGMLAGAWLPVVLVLGAVWSVRRRSRLRAVLRRVLRDGSLRFARLLDVKQTQLNKSAVYKKFRYDSVFDVDGRKVKHSTINDGMSMLNRGQLIEVVYTQDVPDEIVPTFLLV